MSDAWGPYVGQPGRVTHVGVDARAQYDDRGELRTVYRTACHRDLHGAVSTPEDVGVTCRRCAQLVRDGWVPGRTAHMPKS